MIRIYFVVLMMILFFSKTSYSQIIETKYFKDIHLKKECLPSKANFSTTLKLENGDTVNETKDMQRDILIRKELQSGEPLGLWKYKSKDGYVDLNYNFKLNYSPIPFDTNSYPKIMDYTQDDSSIGYKAFRIINGKTANSNYTLESLLSKFISNNLIYPKFALENGIAGKVHISLAISNSGEIEDIAVLKSAHVSLDKEAVRLVNLLKFSAAEYNGQRIRSSFVIPFVFYLEE